MKSKKIFFIGFGILVGLMAAYELTLYFLLDRDPHYLQIDRCLDLGGCWDGIDKVCRQESELNAQELCDRSKLNGKTLEQRINEKIDKINPDN